MLLPRLPRLVTAISLLALAVLTCTPGEGVGPAREAAQGPVGGLMLSGTDMLAVRISEIHYDNAGTDAGEAIEISGPAGMDVTGWRILLYNGNGGATYEPTRTLSGVFPATCGARGVLLQTYGVNGIQNGDPDGIALVNAAGAVVEFLSYEGTFTGVGGPANGVVSRDIGVAEGTSTPVGHSLQRTGADVWREPAANTFGACNDDDEPPPPPPPPPPLPATRFAELHYDNDGTDLAEAIELEGPAGTDLTSWSVVLYNGNGGAVYDTRFLSGSITARCGSRGVIRLTYPSNGIQNGSPDGLALVSASGVVVEFLSYEGVFAAVDGPAAGLTSTDIGVSEAPATARGSSLARLSTGAWQPAAPATFGACNEADPGPPPPPVLTLSFSGRTVGDAALPVGFQDQLFATVLDPMGAAVPTSITWSVETPATGSIDQDGVLTALGAGTVTVRATAADGSTATTTLPTIVATAGSAVYLGNAEFGEPADGDPSDNVIVRRPQYTASFNPARGIPNWVSYNLEATHFGPQDRCDCFTFDPAAPGPSYTTAAYTGSGAFHGFLIDRGHLARSFDRTSGTLDNATTFYFSNIVPQAADLNQGPWAEMEIDLGNLARFENREVYIITGGAGTRFTLKNEGRITMPASMWKVALILPRDQGLGDIDSYDDVEVIAVIMPNEAGVRNVDWETYKTTVDAVEALNGYDLLALLPDPIEIAVESNTQPPAAATDGPYASLPHLPVAMSAAGSSDPDDDALTYAWTFGDGAAANGVAVSHRYAAAGVYPVRLIVTDIRGLADTTTTSVTIITPLQAIANARALLDDLVADDVVNARDGKWLGNKLDVAAMLLARDLPIPTLNQLEEVLRPLEGTEAEALIAAVTQVIQSLRAGS